MVIQVDMDFILANDMNVEQYVLCYLLYEDEKVIDEAVRGKLHEQQTSGITYLYKYFNQTNSSENLVEWKRKDIKHLLDLGFLEMHNAGRTNSKWSADNMSVTQEFISSVFLHKDDFDQLLEVYPSKTTIDGRVARLNTISNYQQLTSQYAKFVKTKKLHRRILRLVEWAKKNNMLTVGIEKFVNSRLWESLEDDYRSSIVSESEDSDLMFY